MTSQRLLMVAPSQGLWHGGIERAVLSVEKAWPGPLKRVNLVSPPADGPPITRDGMVKLPLKAKLSFARSTVREARRFRPDVVFALHVNLLPVAVAAARATRSRVGVLAYGTEVWGPMSAPRQHLLRRCEHLLAISHFTGERLSRGAGIESAGVRVVPLPVSDFFARAGKTASASGADSKSPYLLTVSRFGKKDWYKGHFEVARALPRVLEDRRDLSWVVVGDGDALEALRSECRSLGIEHAVTLTGRVSDNELLRLYSGATALVLPSVADADRTPPVGEGLGLVYLEAGLFGVPSIASEAAGGAAEVVQHGVTGLMVPPHDQDSLAEAMGGLVLDTGARDRLGAAARRRVLERHLPEHFSERLADALARPAAQASGTRARQALIT